MALPYELFAALAVLLPAAGRGVPPVALPLYDFPLPTLLFWETPFFDKLGDDLLALDEELDLLEELELDLLELELDLLELELDLLELELLLEPLDLLAANAAAGTAIEATLKIRKLATIHHAIAFLIFLVWILENI